MAIAISCPSCGAVAKAPDSAAGKSARCRKCGNSVTIPATGTPEKLCTSCGVDVSGQKRTKDTAGRYFCQPCWQAKLGASQRSTTAGTPRSASQPVRAAATSSSQRKVAPPELARAKAPAPLRPALAECTVCANSVPENELVPGDNDQMICRACATQEMSFADLPDEPVAVDQNAPYRTPVLPLPPLNPSKSTLGYQSKAPPRAKPARVSGSAHDHALILNGLICGAGIALTVGTYLMSHGHGTFIVAWGAILFGGIRFVMALIGKLSGG